MLGKTIHFQELRWSVADHPTMYDFVNQQNYVLMQKIKIIENVTWILRTEKIGVHRIHKFIGFINIRSNLEEITHDRKVSVFYKKHRKSSWSTWVSTILVYETKISNLYEKLVREKTVRIQQTQRRNLRSIK